MSENEEKKEKEVVQDQPVTDEPEREVPPRRVEVVPEKTLLTWRAAARPFRKRTREFYSTLATIVILLSVILFFAREFLLIGVVLSLAFVAYILDSVPPGEVDYMISNKGFYVGTVFYSFELLGRFWFESKRGQEMVMLEHIGGFPGVVMAVLKENKAVVERELGEYMLQQQPAPTPVDKAADWLAKKVPLESE